MSINRINPYEFNAVNSKVKAFFQEKGLIECYVQNKLSILASCEDPTTISSFNYANNIWPLPQTGQMHLEDIIMDEGPECKGFHCTTTSYRQEPNPVPGRHDLIFPMFEFEIPGDLEDLINIEKELLEYIGFGDKNSFPEVNYEDMCKKYNVEELDHCHEMQMYEDYGPVVFLKYFPESTSPFWNMNRCPDNKQLAKKVDVIVCGIETIGSAERSCNPDEMRESFHTISEGGYANTLYAQFSKERVENELEEFLSHKFFVRSGAGMGVTRLIRAMKIMKLI
jgi:aspartyl/asparaginyl-tRNA synthetase